MPRSTRALIALAVALALGAVAPAAIAVERNVASVAFTFLPQTVDAAPGDTLILRQLDPAPHNVVAIDSDADGPLFSSGPPASIGSYPVDGVDELAPGSYGYLCTLHPFMTGTLNVSEGAPTVPSLPDLPAPPPPPTGLPVPAAGVAVPVGLVPTPTSATVHQGALYVASFGGGVVYRMAILPGGALGPPAPFAAGFSSPLGIAFGADGTLYVADSHASTRPGRTIDGRVQALPPGGVVPEVVIDGLPNGRHNTNGLAVKDGRLYVANGNSTDDGVSGGAPEEPLSGTLLSVPAGARGLSASSPEVVVEAAGMRNPYDVAFRPGTDEAWLPVNGPDALDPFGEDTLHRVAVGGGQADFGFPGCVYAANPFRVAVNPAIGSCNPLHTPPEQLMGLHTSANGIAFGPQDSFWDGDMFVAQYGNNPGETPAGRQVVRVRTDAAGNTQPPETFLPDVSPLDVTFGPDGMYVADFTTGRITLVRQALPSLPAASAGLAARKRR